MTPAIWLPMMAASSFVLLQEVQVPLTATDYTVPAVIGQIIILLTTIAGFLYTIYRENRNRRWDLQDRELARKELSQKLENQQEQVAAKVVVDHKKLIDKIDENTKITTDALINSNMVHSKMDALALAFDNIKGRTTALESKSDGQTNT
jgi:seryl-tRNA synthetase